jgi:hypothetical protein
MVGSRTMTKDILRYDKMVETALRGVVREALLRAAQHGLPGSHHFYVTFRTGHPGVGVPEYLRAQYPQEMTIVLEHQFWELSVADDAFSVTLSFKNRPERLTVPFIAITAFADPSVKFALQFQEAVAGEEGDGKRRLGATEGGLPAALDAPPRQSGDVKPTAEKPAEGEKKAGEVVTLDAFRKK